MSDLIEFCDKILLTNLSEAGVSKFSRDFALQQRHVRISGLNSYFAYLPGPHKYSKERLPLSSKEYKDSLVRAFNSQENDLVRRNKVSNSLCAFNKTPFGNRHDILIYLFSLMNTTDNESRFSILTSRSKLFESTLLSDISNCGEKSHFSSCEKSKENSWFCKSRNIFLKSPTLPRACQYMGALTTFKSSSVVESGDILEIPSTFLKDPFAKFSSQSSFSTDSGFVTKSHSRTSMKSIQVSLEDISQVRRFTDKSKGIANSNEIDTSHPWEDRNSSISTKEKPFITEMGSLSAHALVSAFKSRYQQSPQIKVPSEVSLDSITSESLTLQRSSFIHDLLLSHLGVISTRFYWLQKGGESPLKGVFAWRGDPLDTLAFNSTHGSLFSLLESHLHSATAFRRLDWLASKPLLGCDVDHAGGYHGNVWSALRHGLSEWLRVYTVTLERTVFSGRRRRRHDGAELLELTHCLHPMMTNMLAVAHAFGVSPTSTQDNAEDIQVQYLSGIRLLAWIGHQVITSSPNTSRSLEFIFHRAATPFIRFLQLWTKVGVIEDPHNEFSVSFNYRFLHRKDANFWRYAVHYQSLKQSAVECLTLRKESEKQDGALFGLVPASAEVSILRCGLSVHLLRSISPNHFLFENSNAFPCLTFPCLSLSDLRRLIENHQSVIKKASEALKLEWMEKLLKVEDQKRKELRKALDSYASKRNARLAKEKATREVEFQKRQALRQEAEEAIREKRKRELELLAALQREEIELLRLDAAQKIIVEEEKERLLREHGERMSELDERIREAAADLQYSQKSRHPLAVLNTEEISSRQTVSTKLEEREAGSEFAENAEGIVCPPEEEKKKDNYSHGSSLDSRKCSPIGISFSNKHLESVNEGKKSFVEVQNKSNESRCAKVTHFQSKHHFNREDFEGNRARDIIYGKGLGPTARDSAWEKPKPREHLPDDVIIAFSQELLEPSQLKTSPWFDPAINNHAVGCSNPFSVFLRSLGVNSIQGQICSAKYQAVPFFSALDRVIARPLLARAEIVDRCLLEHFVMELRLLEHLRFVKSIFCHEHATISPQILDALFNELSNRGEARNIFNDKRRFEDLVPCELFKLQNSPKFEIGFEQVPFYFKQLKTVPVKNCRGHVDRVFKTLVFVYNTPWPINICLHERVLAKYNTIFCIIGRIKYALWELESVYRFLREHRKLIGNDMECDHHFQISARRHGMEVIVRALYSYISLHTVQSQWGAFAKQIGGSLAAEAGELMLEELTKAKSLDEVCEKHEACVDSILHSCLIDDTDEEGQQIRESLMGLLECPNRFRRALLSSQYGKDHSLDVLTALQDRFRKHAQILHGILKIRIYETSALSHLLQTLEYFCTTIC